MGKIREVLRLKLDSALSVRKIACSQGIGHAAAPGLPQASPDPRRCPRRSWSAICFHRHLW